jgi:Kdo2-lipid IVA lauroyltransferase/acyltransferase
MFYLIYAFFWIITSLPLKVLYATSDLFYYLVYHIVGYRRKVVRRNLTNSFPEKSIAEIIEIEKKFYHFFSDIFIETMFQIHLSKKNILSRMTFINTELITQQYEQNKSVMLMTAHYGNWEWISSLAMHLPADKTFYGIYKRLTNKHFDKLMSMLRMKFGGGSIESQDLFKTMFDMRNNSKLGAFVMVADQRPAPQSSRHWINFLHQDTSVLIGTEKLAKKFNYPVLFMNVIRVKRGYYTCEFEMIEPDPKSTEGHEITEKYMYLLEEKIKKYPEFWLWTHNRWKHKRPID